MTSIVPNVYVMDPPWPSVRVAQSSIGGVGTLCPQCRENLLVTAVKSNPSMFVLGWCWLCFDEYLIPQRDLGIWQTELKSYSKYPELLRTMLYRYP